MTPEAMTTVLKDRLRWAWTEDAELAGLMADDIVGIVWPAVLAEKSEAWARGRADQAAADADPTLRGAKIRWLDPYSGEAALVGVERGVVPDDGE